MNNKETQKIIIDLPNGMKLVAEQNNNPNFKNEIFIGVMKDDGVWYQDLAIVRNSYYYNKNGEVVWADDRFNVLVYADKDDKDFTDYFAIGLYHGGI